jgi:alpha-mannosidase
MRLSLLRGPLSPDPECDVGKHQISWAIYPHVGTFAESDVSEVAYAFNVPLQRKSISWAIYDSNFLIYFLSPLCRDR